MSISSKIDLASYKDKTIIITGAGRGIGKSIAIHCASHGARVVLAARSKSEVDLTTKEIRDQFNTPVIGLTCDVSKSDDVERLVDTTEKEMGPIYGLVCAAGIYGPIGPFEDVPFEEWKKTIDVNLVGTALCIHKVIRGMKSRKEGRIVLFSGGGQAAMPRFSAYVTGKGGIWRLTETLGAEFAEFGVYLNSVAPGAINTKLLDDLLAAGPEKVGREVYEKSLRQKEEGGASVNKACDLVSFLLSRECEGLAGKTLSALWDPYRELGDLKSVSKTDLYTMRRVVNSTGGTRG